MYILYNINLVNSKKLGLTLKKQMQNLSFTNGIFEMKLGNSINASGAGYEFLKSRYVFDSKSDTIYIRRYWDHQMQSLVGVFLFL